MWGAIISGIFGLGKMAYGAYQKNKASKMNSAAPDYNISDQYYNNIGLAESELANGGLSPDTLNRLTQVSQQNLAASTNAILQGGGSVNDIARLYGVAGAQNAGLAQLNEQLRMPKIQQLMEARKELAGQEIVKWRTNQYNRWKDKQVAAAMLGASGNQMINSGLDTVGSAAVSGANNASQKSINSQISDMQKTMGIGESGQVQATDDNLGNPVTPEYPTLAETQSAIGLDSNLQNPFAYQNTYNDFNQSFLSQ